MNRKIKAAVRRLCKENGVTEEDVVCFQIEHPIKVFWKDYGAQTEVRDGTFILHDEDATRVMPPGTYIIWKDWMNGHSMAGSTGYHSSNEGVEFLREDIDSLHENNWIRKLE